MAMSFHTQRAAAVSPPEWAATSNAARVKMFEDACRQAGLPLGRKRVAIIRILAAMDDHPDSGEIRDRAARIEPGISIATIYRTLAVFERAGLLRHHDFGGMSRRYEVTMTGRHSHMIDAQSGEVVHFDDGALDALLRKAAAEMGYDLLDYRLELYGEPDRIRTPSGR